jgi:PhzF family phenazine biosynthesis protein
MSSVLVFHYSSFTTQPGKGNPAGLVLDADELTTARMQEIAHRVGFNETTFVCHSTTADLRLRYFTPGYEMDLCGHGTIAALYALQTRQLLKSQDEPVRLTVETRAGLLPMSLREYEGRPLVRMRQAEAEFRPFGGSRSALADVLGLQEDDLAADLPVRYASTGTWTLLVPIRSLAAFARMNAQNERFPALLPDMPRCSLHPFCLQTHDPATLMHGRHFSSPLAGTREDPVTGTASGAMGAYYMTYIQPQPRLSLLIEQGHEIGREGHVLVEAERGETGGIQVSIEGTAVYEKEWTLELADDV